MRKAWSGRKTWVLLASILASPSIPVLAQSNLYTFSGDVDLGLHYTAFLSSGQHYIGARGDTVYVVTSNGLTWCSKSTDGGQTFGSPFLIDAGYNPSMRVDTAGIVYVAYQDQYADIRFSKSTDGGMTFAPGLKVNDDTISTVGQEKPTIAVNKKGQIFIAWSDQRTAPGQPHRAIFSAASFNGGISFTPNVQVNEVGNPAAYRDMAVDDSGRVYVAYPGTTGGRSGIVLARSVDSGQSFSYYALANDSPWFAGSPSIAVSADKAIGIAWTAFRVVMDDSLEYMLRFSASDNYGQTFFPSVRIDDDSDLTSVTAPQAPSLFFKNGVFYVAWRDPVTNDRISFSYSPNSGEGFVPSVNVNPFNSHHLFPSLAVNGSGRAFVAWLDDRRDPFLSEDYHTFVAWGIPEAIKGDLNLDGILTVVDAVMELNAVFLGQPFPAPSQNADVNCDGKLTPVDAILEINAVYSGNSFLSCST